MRNLIILLSLTIISAFSTQSAQAACGGFGYILTSTFWSTGWKTNLATTCEDNLHSLKFKEIYRGSPIEIWNRGYKISLKNKATGATLKRNNIEGGVAASAQDPIRVTFDGTNNVKIEYLDDEGKLNSFNMDCEIESNGIESCGGKFGEGQMPTTSFGSFESITTSAETH